MTLRLAISNQKGGTGKTTVAVNLAGALADRDRRVLLIDLDPQGYATEATGLADAYDADGVTLHDVLLDVDEQSAIGDVIQSGNEFDVLPSNTSLAANNTESALKQATGGEKRLGMALDELDQDYDFVVVDCPPGLGALTDNALLACEHVVIPAEAKGTSMRAVELLSDQIASLERFFDADIAPVAVVANEARPDGVSDEMLEWFERVFADVPVFEIRKRVALQRAMTAGVSIFEHDEDCDMEAVFDDLAAHLEGQR